MLYEKTVKVWLSLSTQIMGYYGLFPFSFSFLPVFSEFFIIIMKLSLQSEKEFPFLKIVTLKLDAYKGNKINLIYFNLLALSIWDPVVLFPSMAEVCRLYLQAGA